MISKILGRAAQKQVFWVRSLPHDKPGPKALHPININNEA